MTKNNINNIIQTVANTVFTGVLFSCRSALVSNSKKYFLLY